MLDLIDDYDNRSNGGHDTISRAIDDPFKISTYLLSILLFLDTV